MRALRTLGIMVVAYAAAALVLIGMIGGGGLWIWQASAGLLPDTSHEKSAFELQLETARNIREVLAKPLPRPGPLPPITAERANPVPRATVIAEKPRRIPYGAWGAMAMDTRKVPTFQYAPPDRFAPN